MATVVFLLSGFETVPSRSFVFPFVTLQTSECQLHGDDLRRLNSSDRRDEEKFQESNSTYMSRCLLTDLSNIFS